MFQTELREDLRYWVEVDRQVAPRAFDLIEAILRDPFRGIDSQVIPQLLREAIDVVSPKPLLLLKDQHGVQVKLHDKGFRR